MDVLEEIRKQLMPYERLYDSIRIVDPLHKRVMQYTSNNVVSNNICYAVWGRNSFCKNCISMRAYLEKDTIYKIESNSKDKIVSIIAIPIVLNDITYVVELLKEMDDLGALKELCINNDNIAEMIYEINEKTIKDDITGVYNRKYINERLPIDIALHSELSQSISVVLADLDYFEQINNQYGYDIGDCILNDVASVIQRNLNKECDWIGRYGGDQFIIVMNNCDLEHSCSVADQIRKEIESNVFEYDNQSMRVTASFGVDEMKGDISNLDYHLNRMGERLDYLKQEGRNRIYQGINNYK